MRGIHQEDLCQALGVHPESTYQQDGGPTPENIVTLFDRVMPAPAAEDARVRFVDALAYRCKAIGPRSWEKLADALVISPEALLERVPALAIQLPDAIADAIEQRNPQAAADAIRAHLDRVSSLQLFG